MNCQLTTDNYKNAFHSTSLLLGTEGIRGTTPLGRLSGPLVGAVTGATGASPERPGAA